MTAGAVERVVAVEGDVDRHPLAAQPVRDRLGQHLESSATSTLIASHDATAAVTAWSQRPDTALSPACARNGGMNMRPSKSPGCASGSARRGA